MNVSGSNFQPGMTVTVAWPGGGSTLSGTQIQGVSATSFQMLIDFRAGGGAWTIRVNNPNGQTSNVYGFNVTAAPTPSPNPSPAPIIGSISPSAPSASGAGNQTVSVSGSNFQPGLTVTATFPGGSSTLSGTQVQNVSATSFQMLIDFGTGGGVWTIRVNNQNGQQSNVYGFNVNPVTIPAPIISNISPSTPSATGSGNQTVSVSGGNFQSGLTLTVTWPNGTSTLSGTQIQNLSSTSFQMFIDFGAGGGTWWIRANNPNGQQSNVYSFSVNPAPTPAPTISSISPSSPTATGIGNQTVGVSGTNFQSALSVTVTRPGGSSTLTGAQIQSLTATSFQMLIDFGAGGGSWTIRVNNPSGQQSGVFGFSVASASPPTLRIDGGTSSVKQIGQTFAFSGTGFRAGRTTTRFISPSVNGQSVLSPTLTVDGSGNLSWTFSPTCGNPKGTFTIYAVDDATGRKSNAVTQTVTGSPTCP